jgi:hypothetical protein
METLHEREKKSSKENAAFLKRVKIAYALLFIKTFHDQNRRVARRAHKDLKSIRKFSQAERQRFIEDAAKSFATSSGKSRLWLNRRILSRADAEDRDPGKNDGFLSAAYLSPSKDILRTSLRDTKTQDENKLKTRRGYDEKSALAQASHEYELAKAQICCALADSPSQREKHFRDAQRFFSNLQITERNMNAKSEERTNV